MRTRMPFAACAAALLATSAAQCVELPKEFKYLSESDVASICVVQTVRATRVAWASTDPSARDNAANSAAYHLATNVWLDSAQEAAAAEADAGKPAPVVVGKDAFTVEGLLEYCFSTGMQRFGSMAPAKQELTKQTADKNWPTYVDDSAAAP